MGKIIGEDDVHIPALFVLMNERFASSQDFPPVEDPKVPPDRCDGICEMLELQRRFNIFQTGKDAPTFKECAALLNLGGRMPWSLRKKWYAYLNLLTKFNSDDPTKNGSERIVHKIAENLRMTDSEGRPKPKPIYFEPYDDANTVLVEERSQARSPLFYVRDEYSVIRLPMKASPWPDKS